MSAAIVNRMLEVRKRSSSLLLFAGLAILSTVSPGAEHPSDDILNTVLRGLEHRDQLVHSAIGYFIREEYANPNGLKPSEGQPIQLPPGLRGVERAGRPVLDKIRWAFAGVRYREDFHRVVPRLRDPQGRPESYYTFTAFDGERGYRYFYGSDMARVFNISEWKKESDFGSAGTGFYLNLAHKFAGPLCDGVYMSPNQEILSMGGQIDGKEALNGIEAYKITGWWETQRAAVVWWVAPEKDFCILRREERKAIPQEQRGDREYPPVERVIRYDYRDLKEDVPGVWIPHNIRITAGLLRTDGRFFWSLIQNITVLSLDINTEIDPGFFKIDFPLNTRVFTSDGKSYVVGGDTTDREVLLEAGYIEPSLLEGLEEIGPLVGDEPTAHDKGE